MSKYNDYFKQIEDAAAASLDEIKKANDTAQAAKHTLDEAKASGDEKQIAAAKAALAEAQHSVKTAKEDAGKTAVACAAIRADLAAAVHKDSIVNPADVDLPALELLKSGIMQADDYDALAELYAENMTMTRMIAPYAIKAISSVGANPGAAAEFQNAAFRIIAHAKGDDVLKQADIMINAFVEAAK